MKDVKDGGGILDMDLSLIEEGVVLIKLKGGGVRRVGGGGGGGNEATILLLQKSRRRYNEPTRMPLTTPDLSPINAPPALVHPSSSLKSSSLLTPKAITNQTQGTPTPTANSQQPTNQLPSIFHLPFAPPARLRSDI